MQNKVTSHPEAKGLDLVFHALEREKELEKGNQLISQIFTAVKAGRLYEPNNIGFKKPVDTLMNTLNDLFQTQEVVSIEAYMHCLFFNRGKVKTEFQNYTHSKLIIEVLEKRDIDGLYFSCSLKTEELQRFILLLAKGQGKNEITLEDFQKQLSDQNISNISISKFSQAAKKAAEEHFQGTRQMAKRTFLHCIYNLKGIMHEDKSRQKISARRTRRLVQLVVDLIAEDESYLIGLTTIKNHDDYMLNHSVNVSILSLALGQRLGLEKNIMLELGLAGLFHDLGKINIPSEILNKPSSLSPDEFRIVEKHPYHSVEKLLDMKGLGELPVRAMIAALQHHLKYNGSGYPRLFKIKGLDLFSRIVTIADCYDAATTPDRPFRSKPMKPDEALIDLISKKEVYYDPLLLKVFVNMVGIYPIGTLVILDTKELAIVMQTNSDSTYLDRPKVKIITNPSGKKIDGEIVDLTEIDLETNHYKRNIVKSLDSRKYGIDVPKYF